MAYVIKISNEQLADCKAAAIELRKALVDAGCLVPRSYWTRVYTEARTYGYRSKLIGYDQIQTAKLLDITRKIEAKRPGVTLTVQLGGRGDNGANTWNPAGLAKNCWHIFADIKR